MAGIDETQKSILKALNELNKPSGCGDIAKKAGLKVPQVMGKLRGLVKQGLAESPEKGKYIITSKGKAQLK